MSRSPVTKLGLLARLLLTNPSELRDRVLTLAESRIDRINKPGAMPTISYLELARGLSEALGTDIERFLTEDALREIECQIEASRPGLVSGASRSHDATFGIAKLCYAVSRASKPEIVIETGVGNGVTSSFFLQALRVNGKGRLWSIDLPPLGAMSGMLVPDALKSRWELRRGRTRKMLPQLIQELGTVDVFLHDSLHSYWNMKFEFGSAWSALAESGVLLSDDVTMNRAFEEFVRNHPSSFAAVSTNPVFGVTVK